MLDERQNLLIARSAFHADGEGFLGLIDEIDEQLETEKGIREQKIMGNWEYLEMKKRG